MGITISATAKTTHEWLRCRGSGVPLWKLVPLSDGSWEEGISEDFGFGAKQAFSQADVV